MILEQWYIVTKRGFVTEPERSQLHVMGKVYGHSDYVPGATITTAQITYFDGKFCHTESGAIYELGAVENAYGKEYPNARTALQRIEKNNHNRGNQYASS